MLLYYTCIMKTQFEIRELTGKWFLKKRFFGGYDVFVEVEIRRQDPHDLTWDPEFVSWQKARGRDFIELGITGY